MTVPSLTEEFANRSRKILGANLTGIYLHGSAAMGCYNPAKSDLDLIVVVRESPDDASKLAYMDMVTELNRLASVNKSGHSGIEMSIVCSSACNPFQYPTPFELHFSPAHLEGYRRDPMDYILKMKGTDKDLAAHFTVIRQRGRCLFGQPIVDAFGEVPAEDYLDSIREDIAGAPEEIAANPMYFILNLARVLAYQTEKTVLSKAEGGMWGIRNLPEKYHPLILTALDDYGSDIDARYDLKLAEEYAVYMLDRIEQRRNGPMTVLERFLRYVQIETTSSEENDECPSTPGQLVLGDLLAEELRTMGIEDAERDEHGYVYATIPAKGTGSKPAIGLIAHMDTSDAVKGRTVPQLIRNYDGQAIPLKNGVLIDGFDFLPGLKGLDLVVTSGDSVLGADDKAGVAEIMTLCERLTSPDAPYHGKVCVAFTPDEEIGRGANLFDVKRFGADYAYTVDGGALGELEYECFNAASCTVEVSGVSIHPGSAKNQMKNASLIAMEFANMLPAWERPEHTEGYEGFFHLTQMSGNEEKAVLKYIIRDHDPEKFEERKQTALHIGEYLNLRYGAETIRVQLKDSYRNMKEIIERHPEILEKAKNAFLACGVEPRTIPIRGGTDGARLSYMGLPCPNLSTGGYNFHGRKELIPVQSMEKMTDVLECLITDA